MILMGQIRLIVSKSSLVPVYLGLTVPLVALVDSILILLLAILHHGRESGPSLHERI